MIKAVVCDMDGVLIDTEKYLVQFWMQAGREAGFDFKREHGLMLRSLNARDAERMLKEIFGPEFDYHAVRARRRELLTKQVEENGLELKPGVPETLKALRKAGIRTAVATATDIERARDYLHKAGLYDLFDDVISAAMVKQGKPHPDIYLYACEQLGLPVSDCIAVEDSPNGVKAASSAGLITVMVPDLTPPDEALLSFIDYLAKDFCDVLNAVKKYSF